MPKRLAFEKEIYEMEDLLAKLEAGGDGAAGQRRGNPPHPP